MDHWENHTCIRFVPRTTQRDYVTFFPGKGCYSYIGRIGGNQGISVGRWCLAVYIVLHEIGHAIGYFHEQSRPDRDEHVKIIKENIGDNRELQFEKLTEDKVDSYGVGYDYNSIMHYDETAFSRNGNQTIVALDPDIPIGMAQVLSALDIEQTKRLYNCPGMLEYCVADSMHLSVCVCVCVCVCARACVRACVRAFVRRVCVCVL